MLRSGPVRGKILRRGLTYLFVTSVVFISYFALVGSFPQPSAMALSLRSDHLLHIIAFAALSLTGYLLWAPLWAMVVLLSIGGGLLEALQYWLPARHATPADFIASLVGVVLGGLVFKVIGGRRPH